MSPCNVGNAPRTPAEEAARAIIMAHYLYGIPQPRGWSGPVFDALRVLHPEDPRATLHAFWPEDQAR